MVQVQLISPKGKRIHTDLTPKVQEVLDSVGIPWFDAIKNPLNLSEKAFNEIDTLISKPAS